MIRFFDTCALLEAYDELDSEIVISSQSLIELEEIKTSKFKDNETKYRARKVTKEIERLGIEVAMCTNEHYNLLESYNLPINNDNLIVATASTYYTGIYQIKFISNDLLCRLIAEKIFKLETGIIEKHKDLYKGYKIIAIADSEMANFFENRNINHFNCEINEYVILNNLNNEPCGTYKWNGEYYIDLTSKQFKSRMFGCIKPYDDIQRCAFDSIINNDVTVLYGRSGSGKTTIPLGYIMNMIDTHKISKVHCIFHYEPLKNSRTLGYVKGDQMEKKLNTSSIGNILSSKFGDQIAVTNLINSGVLNIMGTYEIRGFEAGENDLIFVTEAQNIDTYTLKTILQRAKEGCKIILEGDIKEQTDFDREVGIFKMIDVFKGYEKFGCIKLKHNYRNKISELADKLDD